MGATLLDKILVEVDASTDAAQRALKGLGKDVGDFGAQVAKVNGGAGGLDGALATIGGRLGGLAGAFTAPATGAAVLGAALTGLAVDAVESAEVVETSLRRVSNLLPNETPAGITGLRGSLVELAHESGVAQGELAGLYEVIAKGGAGTAAGVAAMARAAVQLRDAYGGDLLEHARGLDAIIDSFQLKSTDAEAAAATVYAAARRIGAPLEEMYAAFAKIAPVAQASGLTFEQTAVAIANLNAQGTPLKQQVKTIDALASSGKLAAAAMGGVTAALGTLDERNAELVKGSDEARNATGAAAHALKEELGSAAILAGDEIGRLVNGSIRDLRIALTSGVPGAVLEAKRALAELAHPDDAPSTLGNLSAAGLAAVAGQFGLAKGLAGRAFRNPQRELAERLGGDPAVAASFGAADLEQARTRLLAASAAGVDATAALTNVNSALAALRATSGGLENTQLTAVGKALASLKAQVRDADLGKLQQLRAALVALEDRATTAGDGNVVASAQKAVEDVDKRIAKAEAAADRQQGAADRLTQKQVAARQAFDQATARLSPDQSDNLDAEIAHLVAAAHAAELGQREIDAAVARLRAAAAAKARATGDQIVDEVRAQLVQGVTSAARSAELALQEFDRKIAEARRKGATFSPEGEAQIAAARAARAQAQRIAEDSERLGQTLTNRADASANGEAPLVTLAKLQDLRDRELEQLSGVNLLGQKIALTDAQRVAAKQRLAQIDQQIAAAEGKQSAGAEAAKANAAQVTAKTQQWASSLANVANAAAGIVTIFEGANSELARMLTSVAGVSGGISALLEAGTKAGGFGKLFSSASGIASAAGPLGAIVAGGAGLLSALGGLFGESPEHKALSAAIDKNVQALHENTTKLGTLDIGRTGQSNAAAIGALQQLDTLFRSGQLFGLADKRSAILGKAGFTLSDIQALGKQFGIEVGNLDSIGGVTIVRQLLAALQGPNAPFGDFDQRTSILGSTAAEKLQQYLEALTQTVDTQTQHTAAVAKAILGQFNLATADGRKAAQDYIRQQYDVTKSISGDLAQQLLTLIDAAATEADQNASSTATGSATADGRTASQVASGASQLDQATGLGLADLLRTSVTLEREHLDVSRQLLAAVRSVTPTGPIAPPLLPGYGLPVLQAAPAPNSASGGIVVNFTGTQIIIQGSTPDDIEASAEAAGRGIGRGIRDQLQALDAALAAETQHKLLAAGVLPGQSRPLGTPTAVGGGYVA